MHPDRIPVNQSRGQPEEGSIVWRRIIQRNLRSLVPGSRWVRLSGDRLSSPESRGEWRASSPDPAPDPGAQDRGRCPRQNRRLPDGSVPGLRALGENRRFRSIGASGNAEAPPQGGRLTRADPVRVKPLPPQSKGWSEYGLPGCRNQERQTVGTNMVEPRIAIELDQLWQAPWHPARDLLDLWGLGPIAHSGLGCLG